MPSFKLPEFYMPYPARLNSNLDTARVRAKAWAAQMRILDSSQQTQGSVIWDEQKFNSMDFALFTALTYPDATGPELDLLTDWYLWAWYFDDFFLDTFLHRNDLAGGEEYISQLVAYTPPGVAVLPAPTNPLEAGLSNLWVRTAPTMSADWRSRFSEVVQNHLKNTLLEVRTADQDCFPNPIEYVIEVRRKTVGMDFVVYLLEHALGVEIPPEIGSTRPLRVLKESFADAGALRNDIFSYEKEVLAGEINGVMVVERFLDCDLQRAVDVVNELVTSRMQQFESTALAELPLLFEGRSLCPKVCLDILRYVKGLQDWMAGDFEWMKETDRYKNAGSSSSTKPARRLAGLTGIGTEAAQLGLVRQPDPATWPTIAGTGSCPETSHEEAAWLPGPNGLGTAAARLGLARRINSVAWPTTSPTAPSEGASRVQLPEFYMPFHARRNPHVDTARAQAKAWVVEMGILESGLTGWDESSFDSADNIRVVALIFPDAPSPEFNLVSMWSMWALSFEDFFDETFKRSRDLAGGKAFLDRLPTFMPIAHPETVPVPTNLVERGLADLWSRTAPAMSIDWRRWFSEIIQSVSEGLLWEVLNLIENRISDPVDYIEMRRQTNFGEIATILIHYALSLEIPPEIYNARPIRVLIEAFLDWQGLINDIFSYQREIEHEGEIHNGVLVIQRFLDCDLQQAVTLTNDLVTSRLRQFEVTVATELPALVAKFGLDAAGRENIDRFIQGLQDCIAGHFQGHLVSSRYELTTRPNTTPAAGTPSASGVERLPFGFTRLGTAAARIAPVLSTDLPAPVPVTASASVQLPFGPTELGTAAGPFNLPDFYMPWPARLNPNIEGTRMHTKTWVREMGMLGASQEQGGSTIWDESKFDSPDFALFAALTHPDTPGPELDLLSDWYVWGCFVNDYFLQTYSEGGDLTDAKEFFSRVLALIPIDVGNAAPEPANPVEIGLADLWLRTAPAMSMDWRLRFTKNIRNLAEESMRKLFKLSQNSRKVLDPIEDIGVRRKAGKISWSPILLERALGIEIPLQIYDTRPMRVLIGTFCDSADLRHDIISCRRDSGREDKTDNIVRVVQRFLNYELQEAVDAVNDLVTSRLYQFDNTLLSELPELFEEYEMGPLARGEILRYVQGLKDWMAGDLQWALGPGGGYFDASSDSPQAHPLPLTVPAGLGSAAARIGLSRRAVGLSLRSYGIVPQPAADSFEIPQFCMPFSMRCNPRLDAVRRYAKAWARAMGILGSLPNWGEDKWDSAEFGLLAAVTVPDAPLPQLEVVNDWNVWGFFCDDFFDVFKRHRDLAGAKAFIARLPAFMPIDLTAIPTPTNPVETSLADLWVRTTRELSADLRRQFGGYVQDFAEAGLWELTNLIQHRSPDPVDYIEMRRRTIGMDVTSFLTALARDAAGAHIPSEIAGTAPMRTLTHAFTDWAALVNDIVSCRKEIEDEGEISNSVLVVARFLDTDLHHAVGIVNDVVTSRLHQFESTAATELPTVVEELGLDFGIHEKLLAYVSGLEDYMAGYLWWHLRSGRYKKSGSCHSPRPGLFLGGSTGPGTSAAYPGPWRDTDVPAPVSVAVPSAGRLPAGPNGLGTAAARIRSVRDTGAPQPVPAATHSPVRPSSAPGPPRLGFPMPRTSGTTALILPTGHGRVPGP